jgi:hypothetical protein
LLRLFGDLVVFVFLVIIVVVPSCVFNVAFWGCFTAARRRGGASCAVAVAATMDS